MKRSSVEQAKALFWLRVRKTDYCWFWTGSVNKCGYGLFGGASTGTSLAHRWAWTFTRGPIPRGMSMCHTCDNKRCVNPNHLYPGSHQQNMRDLWARNPPKPLAGEDNGNARLTALEVSCIRVRAARGEQYDSLAEAYGVTDACIRGIVKRKSWKHLPEDAFRLKRPITYERLLEAVCQAAGVPLEEARAYA